MNSSPDFVSSGYISQSRKGRHLIFQDMVFNATFIGLDESLISKFPCTGAYAVFK